jgi:hypothetical protein
MSPDTAKAKICPEKVRLSKQVLESIRAVTALQSEHTANVIRGGEGLPRIELALEAARKRWEAARDAYLAHIREHDC